MVYLFEFNLIIIILTAAHLGQNRFGPKQAKQVNRKKLLNTKFQMKIIIIRRLLSWPN